MVCTAETGNQFTALMLLGNIALRIEHKFNSILLTDISSATGMGKVLEPLLRTWNPAGIRKSDKGLYGLKPQRSWHRRAAAPQPAHHA